MRCARFTGTFSHWRNRMCRVVFLRWFLILIISFFFFLVIYVLVRCQSVICCYFCENKRVRELLRDSDSRFLCRCSGCCHDISGVCSVCACVRVRVCTSWSLIWLAPPFTLEGVVSCLNDTLLPPILTLPEAPLHCKNLPHWPGSCRSKPNRTNPVVIQPDSGLLWTAQPARFLCQQLRAALCLRTSPSHHSQKTQKQREHVISVTVQSAGQIHVPSLSSLSVRQVCCVHMWPWLRERG